MRRPGRPAQALRGAVDCMPLETRRAMRDALAGSAIIVGAYTDRDGGVCPMLAAHRNGGRTSFAAFARAWDRYTRAGGTPRRATERELRALAAMLDASIAIQQAGDATELGAAIADHQASRSRRRAARAGEPKSLARRRDVREPDGTTELYRRRETGERDRTAELHRRHGWAWLRPFRRLDEYERAVRELETERAAEPRARLTSPTATRPAE